MSEVLMMRVLGSELREGADFHAEVERKLGMDW